MGLLMYGVSVAASTGAATVVVSSNSISDNGAPGIFSTGTNSLAGDNAVAGHVDADLLANHFERASTASEQHAFWPRRGRRFRNADAEPAAITRDASGDQRAWPVHAMRFRNSRRVFGPWVRNVGSAHSR